jgi:hypothetical protein
MRMFACLLTEAGHVVACLCSWAVPLDVFMAVLLTRRNAEVCASPALSSPAAQALTHQAYGALRTLRAAIVPASRASLSPQDECVHVLTYLHLAVGFVLPALAMAAGEARLFERHQRQRQHAGLLPEEGWHCRFYGAVNEYLAALNGFTAAAALWVLLGILFDVAQLVGLAPEP